ncbi:myosin-binding protein 2-like isoform X1 [Gossypium arboreum]|uniref:myosin-binding protein 2-like isoform X1 n=1 Tax=Gossypium arboreum TaxID=29729 RepID=UPI0008191A0E|nr:myosin-binding protein 2-like isoform X1 [Gossypium arboreum]
MVSCTIPSWTLIGLVRSFLDLTLAYFLLCGSTLGFFAWKFFHVFGIHLPCPCSGFFGYPNTNLCWHKLLIQWPRTMIYSVQHQALDRFPFNSVSFNDSNAKPISADGKFGIGIIELEGEACSTSLSGLRLQTIVDKDSGYDAKGKRTINQKSKSGTRRRRRAASGNGKSSAVSLSDDKNTRAGTDMGEATRHDFELSSGEEKGLTFIKKIGFVGEEANRIGMLERALEEEKAKRAAIYLELEKERAAAASAADEAMAMILRLQEDKAAIEMEARQYQRMIEEKFAYDEEEMSILKEMLVRREKENHLLEKELEAYRQMNNRGEEQEECDFSYMSSKGGQLPSIPFGLDEDQLRMVKQAGNGGLTTKKEVERGPGWGSENEIPLAGERSHTADAYLTGKAEGLDDGDIAGQAIATKTVQGDERTCLTGEELKRNVEFCEAVDCNPHDPTVDMEPAVYDIHVVDDKVDILKEENTKESKLPSGSALNHKTLLYDSRGSFSAVGTEMLEIGAEIKCLRERLQIVRGEKVKLSFSSDQRKRIDTHLKLIEELVNQLREFQQLKEPVRQTSLPPLPSPFKVNSNRRRCRSVSDGIEDSA